MTSREKLLQLRHDFYTNDSLDYDSISYFTSIERDLEVLECFKKLFEGEDLDDWIEFNFYVDIPYINKIKEWLKNEKC